ncbi:hypothetical protein HRG_014883 [Hirsutella rhossiliensis]
MTARASRDETSKTRPNTDSRVFFGSTERVGGRPFTDISSVKLFQWEGGRATGSHGFKERAGGQHGWAGGQMFYGFKERAGGQLSNAPRSGWVGG